MAVTVDNKSQYFATYIKYNHSTTVPSANKNTFDQVTLVSDTLQSQQYTTTHMTHHKIPPFEKEYIYFKLMEELPGQHSVTNRCPYQMLLITFFLRENLNNNI